MKSRGFKRLTDEQYEQLKKDYPNTSNTELAKRYGYSDIYMCIKMGELGIRKSKEQ